MNDSKVETKSADPDSAVDALYSQAVRVAQEFGWSVPSRADFELRYKGELAASGKESDELQ